MNNIPFNHSKETVYEACGLNVLDIIDFLTTKVHGMQVSYVVENLENLLRQSFVNKSEDATKIMRILMLMAVEGISEISEQINKSVIETLESDDIPPELKPFAEKIKEDYDKITRSRKD